MGIYIFFLRNYMGIYIERATQQANVELATSRSEGIDVVFICVEAMQQAMGRNRCCACYITTLCSDGIDVVYFYPASDAASV